MDILFLSTSLLSPTTSPADLPQVWELLFAEHLFGSNHEQDSLAMMIICLGLLPSELLERSQICGYYFDDHDEYVLVHAEKWI